MLDAGVATAASSRPSHTHSVVRATLYKIINDDIRTTYCAAADAALQIRYYVVYFRVRLAHVIGIVMYA